MFFNQRVQFSRPHLSKRNPIKEYASHKSWHQNHVEITIFVQVFSAEPDFHQVTRQISVTSSRYDLQKSFAQNFGKEMLGKKMFYNL